MSEGLVKVATLIVDCKKGHGICSLGNETIENIKIKELMISVLSRLVFLVGGGKALLTL